MVDVKPDLEYNFLICDFGFADYAPEAEKQFVAGMKRPSTVGITARYAAPEVSLYNIWFNTDYIPLQLFLKVAVGGSNGFDYKKVDVFAYAMILYYIFTGDKPWGNEMSVSEIETHVFNGERPPIEDKTSLKELICQCWHADPNQRLFFDEVLTILKRQ